MTTTPINFAFMRLRRRAEASEPNTLVDTFVDAGPLFTLLTSVDHQVVYGRRGTGKTHALKFLAQDVRGKGDLAVYVDLRTVGSNVSTYNDPNLPIVERGTRLLADTLAYIQNQLVDDVLTISEHEQFDFTRALGRLDRLAEEITSVRIEGPVEQETRVLDTAASDVSDNLSLAIGAEPSVGASSSTTDRVGREREARHVPNPPSSRHWQTIPPGWVGGVQ